MAGSAGVWGTGGHTVTRSFLFAGTPSILATLYGETRMDHLQITRNLPERGQQMLGESVSWEALPWSLVKSREMRGDQLTAGFRTQKCR